MKTILITTILMSFTVSAETFFIKGYGEAKNEQEEFARGEAIIKAKRDAQLNAHWACWSRQGRGDLQGRSFEIEVISRDMVNHFYAQATALGEFNCLPH
jgi:hypothetical protein